MGPGVGARAGRGERRGLGGRCVMVAAVNATLTLVALLVFAFAVSRLLHRYAGRLAMVSGVEYVVVGALIGPLSPFGLVDDATWESLGLLVTLLLGLLGFGVGLQVRASLRRFEHFLAGAMATLGVSVAVGLGCLALMQALDPGHLADPTPGIAIPLWTDGTFLYSFWASDAALWSALTLGSAAAVASSTAIGAQARRWRAEGDTATLMVDLAVASQALAILVSGLALAGDRAAVAQAHGLGLVDWALVIGGAGALSGVLFTIYISGAEDEERLYVATIGLVIFAAGIGAALGVSPLFVNLVAGLTVAATSSHAERLQASLEQLRRPLTILLLVLAGIAWQPVQGLWWTVPALYLLLRLVGRVILTGWAVSTFVPGAELRRVGGGLFGQDALAAAIALSYTLQRPELGPLVTSAVLVPMLVSDLFAARVLRRVLADAGAIRSHAGPAASESQA